jgi:hypothetical protein
MIVLPLPTQDGEGSDDSSSGCIFGHLAVVHITHGAVDSYGFGRVNGRWFGSMDVDSAVIDTDR